MQKTPPSRPLILLTNDDGIDARGLNLLEDALAPLGRVIVSAPATQQSAVGHGITLGSPLRVRTHGPNRFAVAGRPADAVFLGIGEFCPRRPDLVVSGINHGPNVGVDVLYSGTVAAAMEGALRDIPALAVSQMLPMIPVDDDNDDERQGRVSAWLPPDRVIPSLEASLKHTARFAAAVASAILARPLPLGIALNLNGPAEEATSYRWTRLGRQFYKPTVVRRVDPRGIPYYWVSGEPTGRRVPPDTDLGALRDGVFSITPLGVDWTQPRPSAGFPIAGYDELAQNRVDIPEDVSPEVSKEHI
ncbi:MAG: 5'/3'-nucleotidase SurE [Deltaproteobacteria bacterium]|nr:5'/3'-nucleotidase SurE [Deltaproteobacteria bacterium]